MHEQVTYNYMDNLKRIRDGLRDGLYANNPQGSADDQAILAGEYAWIMGRLEEIVPRRAPIWNNLRKDYKSDTATDRAYEATEDGVNEQILKLQAKSIEKMMSAFKSLINIAQGQANNQY